MNAGAYVICVQIMSPVTQDSTGKASCTDEGGTTLLCGGVCMDTLARR